MKPDETEKAICEWLQDEGFKLTKIENSPELTFDIAFTEPPPRGWTFHAIQRKAKKDMIEIIEAISVDQRHQQAIAEMEDDVRSRFLLDLRLAHLATKCIYNAKHDGEVPTFFEISYPIYYDGLTKDKFMETYRRVLFASLLTVMKIAYSVSGVSESEKTGFLYG